jgi:cell division septum initiation protein DivIVA
MPQHRKSSYETLQRDNEPLRQKIKTLEDRLAELRAAVFTKGKTRKRP